MLHTVCFVKVVSADWAGEEKEEEEEEEEVLRP